jgi:serine/threonine protein kinase
MGPEFWYSTGEVASVYSDIFSFGMIIWEMFYAWATKTYRPPFLESKKTFTVKSTTKTNLVSILTLVCNGSRPVIPPKFPLKIMKLFKQCMATETHCRPQASEILMKVEKWLLKGDLDEWELNSQELHLKLDPICYFKKTDVAGKGENFSFNKSAALL